VWSGPAALIAPPVSTFTLVDGGPLLTRVCVTFKFALAPESPAAMCWCTVTFLAPRANPSFAARATAVPAPTMCLIWQSGTRNVPGPPAP